MSGSSPQCSEQAHSNMKSDGIHAVVIAFGVVSALLTVRQLLDMHKTDNLNERLLEALTRVEKKLTIGGKT
jgi:hypothetical protein